MEIPFVGQAYAARSLNVSAQRCVNWYLEKSPEGGRTSAALYPTPGMDQFATLPAAAQALEVIDGRVFAVCNGSLIEISSNGTVTTRGAVAATGKARIVGNGLQLLVLTGATAYTYDLATNVLTVNPVVLLQNVLQATVVNGYGVFCEPDSQRVRVTDPYNFNVCDSLDFASAEGNTDSLITCERLNLDLWLFGERSTEIWFPSQSVDFPFERNSNTFLEFGLAAVETSKVLDGYLYWLGRGTDGRVTVLRANGYQPELIAHHGIAQFLEDADKAGGVADAWAYTYKERGHPFYCLTLPSIRKTFVFDPLSQAWHERSSYNADLVREEHHRARHCITVFGKTLVTIRDKPTLAEMSEVYGDELTDPIRRVRVCPVIHAQQDKMTASSLEVIASAGIGLSDGQGIDPQLRFRQSVDGGRSWGDWRSESLGRIGETQKRVVFRRLGQAVNRVFEIRCSDPVPVVILGAALKAQVSQ